ncbi:hypothetical protein [Streptomyces sp. LaPpAH-108]|uniref:hypothetical protein n=1 Tax=Streptomyces sp. LaPpAH-108 TaxID=1155714 RepID=UPI000365219F|nr:hypothetical protein [Streptomyces sp. LaPpAH-108]
MQETRPDTGPAVPGTAAGIDLRDLTPTLTLLIISLVVAAVGVYELCGFGLHSLDRRPHLFSDGLATGGVIVAAVAAGAAAGNLAWTLATSRRDGPDEG